MPTLISGGRGNSKLVSVAVFGAMAYLAFNLGRALPGLEPAAVLSIGAVFLFLPLVPKKPSLSVYGFMLFASMPSFTGEGLALNPANLIWLVMVGLLISTKGKTNRLQFTPLDRYLLLAGMVMAISLFRKQFFIEGFSLTEWLVVVGKPLQYAALAYVVYNWFDDISDVKRILYASVAIAALLSIVMLKGFGITETHVNVLSERAGGFWDDPNLVVQCFTSSILTIICLLDIRTVEKKRSGPFQVTFLLGCLGVLAMGVIFGYSRKGYIAVPLGLLCYFVSQRGRGKALFWIIGFLLAVQFVPQTAVERAASIISVERGRIVAGGSLTARMEMVGSGLTYFWENPEKLLIGDGFDGYRRNAYLYGTHSILKYGRDAHNLYIDTLFNSGLIGLFIVLLCYFKIYRIAWELRKISSDYASKAISSLTIAQLLSYVLIYANGTSPNLVWYAYPPMVVFLSTVGCTMVLYRREKALMEGWRDEKEAMV